MEALLLDAFEHLETNPAFWLCLTLGFYVFGQFVFKAAKFNPFASPIIIAVILLILTLVVTGVPYETYFAGAGFIHFLLGPATVALAVPIYRQRGKLVQLWLPLSIGLVAGCTAAMVSVILIGAAFGVSADTLLSLVPKSVTTPIAMGISESIGGMPDLTACFVVLTGMTGSIICRSVFRIARIKPDSVCGCALGVAAHGMGTGAAFQISQRAGAFSGLAMGVSGIISAFLAPLLAFPVMKLLGY
ncbi:LrgB family protein [Sutterella sp.]|uniref:LrgB family protein n=1 Tax=Sutterella sp. TaxID=1981025 RepID=UPI0026DFCA93|nr:LrgB family protein [Sutterella sp.]MDO5532396.1 LrgB family protein [Sutterella sp.]